MNAFFSRPWRVASHWTEPDVVIVGAGASGAAVAWSLAEAGFRVVCLEQGDWVDPPTLPALAATTGSSIA